MVVAEGGEVRVRHTSSVSWREAHLLDYTRQGKEKCWACGWETSRRPEGMPHVNILRQLTSVGLKAKVREKNG